MYLGLKGGKRSDLSESYNTIILTLQNLQPTGGTDSSTVIICNKICAILYKRIRSNKQWRRRTRGAAMIRDRHHLLTASRGHLRHNNTTDSSGKQLLTDRHCTHAEEGLLIWASSIPAEKLERRCPTPLQISKVSWHFRPDSLNLSNLCLFMHLKPALQKRLILLSVFLFLAKI